MGAVAVTDARRQQNTFAVAFLILALLTTQLPVYARAMSSLAAVSPAASSAITPASIATAPRVPTKAAATRTRLAEKYGQLPMVFEANRGQADPSIDFLTRGSGYVLQTSSAGTTPRSFR